MRITSQQVHVFFFSFFHFRPHGRRELTNLLTCPFAEATCKAVTLSSWQAFRSAHVPSCIVERSPDSHADSKSRPVLAMIYCYFILLHY